MKAFFAILLTFGIMTTVNAQEIRIEAIQIDSNEEGSPDIFLPQPIMLNTSPTQNGVMMFSASSGGINSDPTAELFNLLNNKAIREEIDLVDDQYSKMKSFRSEMQKEMQAHFQKMISKDGEIKISEPLEIKKMMEERKKSQREKLDEMLLPHQVDRLKQVAYQMQMENMGTADALVDGALANELDISEKQKKNLLEKSEEIEQELQQKIAELKIEARKKLFKELEPKQRKKLAEIIGDDFKYVKPDYRKQMRESRQRMKEAAEKAKDSGLSGAAKGGFKIFNSKKK